MSKLLDRLDRITRGTPQSMGFARPGNRESFPSLALLAWMRDSTKKGVASLAKAPVDAAVLTGGALEADALEQQIKPLEGSIWGVVMEQPEQDRLEAYKEKGCDFLVFGIEGTPVNALEEGDCARILRIPADLEDSQVRGLEDLPVDIILLRKPAPEGILTLVHLLAISNVRSATSRYLLLEWDGELTPTELEHLRDMGVDGLVVDVAYSSVITTLRERIDTLPRRRPKGDQRSVAVLPHIGGVAAARPQRHEEEEEDEEWDDDP